MGEIFLRFLRRWAEAIAGLIVILIALNLFLWPIKIESSTMSGALNKGDWVFVCKAATWFLEPKQGSVIMFREEGRKDEVTKRIIAVAGDKVTINEGVIFVNDVEIPEEYVSSEIRDNVETKVANGHFLAVGTKVSSSYDLRIIPNDYINRYVLIRFYPFDEIMVYFL